MLDPVVSRVDGVDHHAAKEKFQESLPMHGPLSGGRSKNIYRAHLDDMVPRTNRKFRRDWVRRLPRQARILYGFGSWRGGR